MAATSRSVLQALEPRRLLAAAGAYISSRGTLIVQGDGGNNAITVRSADDALIADIDASSFSFPRPSVKRILIAGTGGDDFLSVLTILTNYSTAQRST